MTDEDRRRRGRPRAEPHSTVSVWIQTTVHDALLERAKQRDESLSKTVRDLLAKRLTSNE
jgi:hypothetical protein